MTKMGLWTHPEQLLRCLSTYNRRKADRVVDWILHVVAGSSRPTRLLDVGCGTGELFTLPLHWALMGKCEIEIYGIDIDEASIERARFHQARLKIQGITFDSTPLQQIE